MLLPRLALGSLLLAAPLLGHAQSPEPTAAPAPRYYVGLAAFHSNFQNLGAYRQSDAGFRVPVQLTAGYQLRPRLALQLGVAYSGRTTFYAYNGYHYSDSGVPAYYDYSNTTTQRTTSVSALARYALTRQPAHRLQVEALGGLTLVHRNTYSRGFATDEYAGGPQTIDFNNRFASNDLLLTGGLGLRYRLCSRLALTFDLTTNYNLNHANSFDLLTGSAALGLRYSFGRR